MLLDDLSRYSWVDATTVQPLLDFQVEDNFGPGVSIRRAGFSVFEATLRPKRSHPGEAGRQLAPRCGCTCRGNMAPLTSLSAQCVTHADIYLAKPTRFDCIVVDDGYD